MLKFQRYKSNTASPLIYYLAILPSWLMFGQWIHIFELDTLGIVYGKFVLIWTSSFRGEFFGKGLPKCKTNCGKLTVKGNNYFL